MAEQLNYLQLLQLILLHYSFKSQLMQQRHKNHGDIYLKHRQTVSLILDWDEFAWGKESTNTVVAASDEFLKNKGLSCAYLTAHKKAVEFIQENPEEAQDIVIKHLKDLTGKEINKEETAAAFARLEVTTDVNEQVIQEMADISKEAGYITSSDIEGMIDLSFL